jgi:hypothetical protein
MPLSDTIDAQMNEMLARIRQLEMELAETHMVIANKQCPHCSCYTSSPNAAAARASAIVNGLITPTELFGTGYDLGLSAKRRL